MHDSRRLLDPMNLAFNRVELLVLARRQQDRVDKLLKGTRDFRHTLINFCNSAPIPLGACPCG